MIRKEVDVFKAKLRAARNVTDISCEDACWLSVIKRAWIKDVAYLSNADLKRLTKLAKKGGWTAAKADNTFAYVEEDPCASQLT